MPTNAGKIFVAEAIGTFTLIFIGVLAIYSNGLAQPPNVANLAAIGLAHGLAIGVSIASLGAISGGHFNPAVTFGFVVTGRMKPTVGLMYWVAQLVGASIAGFLALAVVGQAGVAGGTPDLGKNVSPVLGVVVEAVLTFFLVSVIFGTAVDERAPKSIYPLAIGLTIALDIMAGGPITGAAMNPARTFGSAIASGHWDNHWVYWVGPLIGGAVGACVHHFFLLERSPSLQTATRGGPAPSEERGEAIAGG